MKYLANLSWKKSDILTISVALLSREILRISSGACFLAFLTDEKRNKNNIKEE